MASNPEQPEAERDEPQAANQGQSTTEPAEGADDAPEPGSGSPEG